jgi:hypothetical protein
MRGLGFWIADFGLRNRGARVPRVPRPAPRRPIPSGPPFRTPHLATGKRLLPQFPPIFVRCRFRADAARVHVNGSRISAYWFDGKPFAGQVCGHGQKVACRISRGGVSCDEPRGPSGGNFPGGPGSGVIPGLQGRREGDAKKVKVARRLRQETTMTLSWVAERFKLERAGPLASLLRKAKVNKICECAGLTRSWGTAPERERIMRICDCAGLTPL